MPIEASFTKQEDLPQHPQPCSRCRKLVPYDQWKENFILNRHDTGGKGSNFCNGCYRYYLVKPTTTGTQSRIQNGYQLSPDNPKNDHTRGPSVDLDAIKRSTSASRRLDPGRPPAKVAAFSHSMAPPPIPPNANHAPVPPYGPLNGYGYYMPAPPPPPTANPNHGPAPQYYYGPAPPNPPLGSSPYAQNPYQNPRMGSGSQNGSQQNYGYTPEHSVYDAEMKKWMRRKSGAGASSSDVFAIKFQLYRELEQATAKKNCEPFYNVADTIMIEPSTTGYEIALLGRRALSAVLARRASDFHNFKFDLDTAEVREPSTWLDLIANSGNAPFHKGWFYESVMGHSKPRKGSKAPVGGPKLEFKAPKEPPVIGIIISISQYNSYMDYVEELEIEKESKTMKPLVKKGGRGKNQKRPSVPSAEISTSKKRRTSKANSTSKDTVIDIPSSEEDDDDEHPGQSWRIPSLERIPSPAPSFPGSLFGTNGANGGGENEDFDLEYVDDPNQESAKLEAPQDSNPTPEDDLKAAPFTAPAKLQPSSQLLTGLDVDALKRAMISGGTARITASQIAPLMKLTGNVIITLVRPKGTITDFLSLEVPSFVATLEQAKTYQGLLSVTPSPLGKGGFKTAHAATLIGCLDPNRLSKHFDGQQLVAKRLYTKSGRHLGGMKRLPVQEELLHIINECNLMYWCSTIMRCAYQFISAKVEEKGEPPSEIPNLRFVRSGFCYAISSQGSLTTTQLSMAKLQKGESISPMITLGYMLEEMIHGDFVKYIHNGHPVPCTEPPLSDEEYKIAEFLCFTQHVQYLQTKGLVFISDYQGSGNLLTDPQILTSDLGVDMFGLGNVKEGFNRFTTEHSCNKYCKWFELSPLAHPRTAAALEA
ncbi:hypothetical protein D9611_014249 [Ephemerocybe angulata]|uniref:Alpha-type protein kinase domain-containing protein n=1 Tax=Ephemerocybe angulata TaxID=980116 RepID=A0A8H5B821_9AGAR|nr:hypothetical protein D9611_014249 [Tulosesus angulatus]